MRVKGYASAYERGLSLQTRSRHPHEVSCQLQTWQVGCRELRIERSRIGVVSDHVRSDIPKATGRRGHPRDAKELGREAAKTSSQYTPFFGQWKEKWVSKHPVRKGQCCCCSCLSKVRVVAGKADRNTAKATFQKLRKETREYLVKSGHPKAARPRRAGGIDLRKRE